jgi:hypothetical protein
MNSEIGKGVDSTLERSLVSVTAANVVGRGQRGTDRRPRESQVAVTGASAEELVVDDRCDLRPAQMVETKLTRVLGGGMVPVSHLQMRGMLHPRSR